MISRSRVYPPLNDLEYRYNGSGELLTIDGVTHYTENLMSGRDEGRLLRSEKHLCRRVR
jgi:hypothetical protein